MINFSCIRNFIKKYPYTCLLFVLLFLTTLLQIGLVPSLLFTILNVFAIIFLIYIFSGIKIKFLRFTFLFLTVAWLTFDSVYAVLYSNYITTGIMASIMETGKGEIQSVLRGYILPGFTIFVILSLLVFKSQDELKYVHISLNKVFIGLVIYLFMLIPGTAFLLYIKTIYQTEDTFDIARSFNYFKGNCIYELQVTMGNKTPLIFGNIIAFLDYREKNGRIQDYYTISRKLPEGIIYSSTGIVPEKIYLVIGESASRGYFSLYGYDIPTTPFADSLSVTDDRFSFYNGMASSLLTRLSVPFTLSFSSPREQDNFFFYKNIMELAGESGYTCYWISNQDPVGFTEGYITAMAKSCSYEYYEKRTRNKDDLDLIPVLREKQIVGKKQFFIIHLQGSHISFSDKFDKTDLKAIDEKGIKGDYLRSIHHTDRVLREIYKIMKEKSNSVLYYISDHGESPESGGRASRATELSIGMYEVPFMVYDNTRISVDTIIRKYRDGNNIINIGSSYYILAEILGYKVSQENIDKAIEEGEYIVDMDLNIRQWKDIPDKTKK